MTSESYLSVCVCWPQHTPCKHTHTFASVTPANLSETHTHTHCEGLWVSSASCTGQFIPTELLLKVWLLFADVEFEPFILQTSSSMCALLFRHLIRKFQSNADCLFHPACRMYIYNCDTTVHLYFSCVSASWFTSVGEPSYFVYFSFTFSLYLTGIVHMTKGCCKCVRVMTWSLDRCYSQTRKQYQVKVMIFLWDLQLGRQSNRERIILMLREDYQVKI